jgi:hypothetical protein
MTANGKIGAYCNGVLSLESGEEQLFLGAEKSINVLSNTSTIKLTSAQTVHIAGVSGVNMSATGPAGALNFNANVTGGIIALLADSTSGQIQFDASLVLTNTGAALGTPIATFANADYSPVTVGALAYTTNRVPLHEPWGRTMILTLATGEDSSGTGLSNISDVLAVTTDSAILELTYDDDRNGQHEYGEVLTRNAYWRR